MPHVTCQVSGVRCHVSLDACHLSPVTCHQHQQPQPQTLPVDWFTMTQKHKRKHSKRKKLLKPFKPKNVSRYVNISASSLIRKPHSTGKRVFLWWHKHTTNRHCDLETESDQRADAVKILYTGDTESVGVCGQLVSPVTCHLSCVTCHLSHDLARKHAVSMFYGSWLREATHKTREKIIFDLDHTNLHGSWPEICRYLLQL